jgi:hypothetical protein
MVPFHVILMSNGVLYRTTRSSMGDTGPLGSIYEKGRERGECHVALNSICSTVSACSKY